MYLEGKNEKAITEYAIAKIFSAAYSLVVNCISHCILYKDRMNLKIKQNIMAKKIGIDLGSASLGWFIREENQIINNGVVTFSTGMTKGTGGYSSPTKDRREARSKRRLIQARKYRKIELLKVLVEYFYVPLLEEELEIWSKYKKGRERKFPETDVFKKWLACDFTYLEDGTKYNNPYELRVKAIDNKLTKHEFGRALYHLVQRRGYKDIGEKDNETKTQIERRGESGFKAAMENENNRTIAEALTNDFLIKGERVRNEYPYRGEYEKEFQKICEGQGFDISQNEKNEYTDILVKKLRKAIIWQRPLRNQKGNIGKCTLEPSKQRCPASHPIFEIFRTWAYINTIKYIDADKNKQEIPVKYRKELFNEVFLKKDKNFKFDVVQKHLDKLFQEKKTYNYLNKSTKKYDSVVSGMPVCKGLINFFGENAKEEISQLHTYNIGTKKYNVYNNYSVYDLWHLISETDDDHIKDFAEKKLGIESVEKENKKGEKYWDNKIVNFKNNYFSTSYADLSLKAMCKIIPFLQEGFLYNEATLLAKIPEEYKDWEENKEMIYALIEKANKDYSFNKTIVGIANNLIDKYKALSYNDELRYDERFAYKNKDYKLAEDDLEKVKDSCISTFGQKTWEETRSTKIIIEEVSIYYQSFFADEKRRYIELPTLTALIEEEFKNNGIEIDGERLYHHSYRPNLYPEPVYSKKYDRNLLAVPLIDSIKNPMFNKSMSVLRKLINELIVQEYVDEDGVIQTYLDEDTEIIVEVARELNDNNKRIAIENYQRYRRDNREKYRGFIQEFKKEYNKPNLNVDKNIPIFEMWTEQIFEEAYDEKGKKIINESSADIRKEKDAIKRYELWMEQKGQCMYTGKMIRISQLFSSDIEIEHTIPRSLLPDNTMANKTVCYSKYNSDIKNNKIPTVCPNFESDTTEGTAIKPRLEKWEKIRDHYKKHYKDRTKPFGNEDEARKNKRIQEKHYFRMHFEYWKDKINRFTTKEIKDSWVRRQLTDTQMVSKYAREYLKTYFKKVVVQKGSTTAEFRKIFGFQSEDEIKSRNKHTHHSIDAAVLTLIPTNSSKRVGMLNVLHKALENKQKIKQKSPDGFLDFNAQELIRYIDNNTLIVNYQKDKVTEQTYRNLRKRGKLQYLKNIGKYVFDDNGEKIPLKTKGTTIRGKLFQETFIGKIKDVERDEKNKPIRNDDGSWRYLKGKDEFKNVVRKPIADVKISDIIDPDIKKHIENQLGNGVSRRKLKDHQGNIIRHVRVKTRAGKKVKDRLNYKSKHDYKNAYYSAAGEIPYAIFITNLVDGRIERKMIPVAIHEVAQTYKDYHEFTPEVYLEKFHPEIEEYKDIKLLKVGQKVFVLKDDNEYERKYEIDFQVNRMYKITQFKYDGSKIMLKYHLEAQAKSDIDNWIKQTKSDILDIVENDLNIEPIIANESIEDNIERKKDYEKRKINFNLRLKLIEEKGGKKLALNVQEKIEEYKTESSKIINEGETPILGLSRNNWNFLFENYDFEIDIIGKLTWLE